MHSKNEEEDVESEEDTNQSDEDSDIGDDVDEVEPWIVYVWKQMREEANTTNESFLDIYKSKVIFTKSLTRNETHLKVMDTFKKDQEEDDMDFDEALNLALYRRKVLIVREFKDDPNNQYMQTITKKTTEFNNGDLIRQSFITMIPRILKDMELTILRICNMYL